MSFNINYNDYYFSVNAAKPGNTLPSSNSMLAPPPVEIHDFTYHLLVFRYSGIWLTLQFSKVYDDFI